MTADAATTGGLVVLGRDEVAGVLAEHRYREVLGDYEVAPYYKHFGCSCGWEQNIAGMSGYWSWRAAHDAHLADALVARGRPVAEVAAGFAEDEARSAAVVPAHLSPEVELRLERMADAANEAEIRWLIGEWLTEIAALVEQEAER